MSRMTTPGAGRPLRVQTGNDIYTALLLAAFLFALFAFIYVLYRSASLFGSVLPPGGS